MVHWQLCTLDHLMNSGFGRPLPHHGLHLLYWFARHCVTCELDNFVVIMKLVSDCQPEKGVYGFHLFGNIEELLPVLDRPRKRKKKLLYFEVGNLNTETYPESANLPTYVRENYVLYGNCSYYNSDRIIISYRVTTRVVETVYVTEHDGAVAGKFSPDRTHEISSELIQALQSPQLDLTTFLTQMGYYGDDNVIEEIPYLETPAQQMGNIVQNYRGSTARAQQSDYFRVFSEIFNQHLDVNIEPFSYDQQVRYIVNVPSQNSIFVSDYNKVQHKNKRPKAIKGPNIFRQSYWRSGWERAYEGVYEGAKKGRGGGGISFGKILFYVGALYLAAKCFSWLKGWWRADLCEKMEKMLSWGTSEYQRPHVMLDYVY